MSTGVNGREPSATKQGNLVAPPVSPAPAFQPDTPNQARIYDYLLGGKDNYAVDRQAGDELIRQSPGVRELARSNRLFMGRAVRYLASEGIRQYIDIGTGLPGPNPVHKVARRLVPDSRVVYTDNDPSVVVHGRALLADGLRDASKTIMLRADLQDPTTVFERHKDSRIHKLINWNEPIAVLLVAVLHFVPDADDPAEILAQIRVRLPAGSYLVISHVTPGTMTQEELHAARTVYKASGGVFPRTGPEIEHLCQGLDLVEPGLVPLDEWRPDQPTGPPPEGAGGLAAVGKVIHPVDLRSRDLDRPRRQAV